MAPRSIHGGIPLGDLVQRKGEVEDRIQRHLVEGVHAGGKAKHRQLGAHGLVRRGELGVAGGQRDREQTEFGHGQQNPRGPRDSEPVATPGWVGPCLRLTVYSNLPMRIGRRSVPITRPLGRRGQLPNIPGSLVARLVHPMALTYSEAVVRWGC